MDGGLIDSFRRSYSFFAFGVFELVHEHVEVKAHDHGHADVLAEVEGLLEDQQSVERWDHHADVLEARHFAGLGVSVGQRLGLLGQRKGDAHEEEQEPGKGIKVFVVGESQGWVGLDPKDVGGQKTDSDYVLVPVDGHGWQAFGFSHCVHSRS